MAGKKNKRPGRREHLNDFRAELNGEYIYEGAYYVPVSGSLADFCKKTRILTAIAVLLGFCPGFIIGVDSAAHHGGDAYLVGDEAQGRG